VSHEVSEVHLTKLYREVRTREVEDGWLEPHELKQPYPYRMDAGVEYRLVFSEGGHAGGRIEEGDLEMIHHEEKGPVIISVEGCLYPLAPGYHLVRDYRAI
jgi:hypothetical protein